MQHTHHLPNQLWTHTHTHRSCGQPQGMDVTSTVMSHFYPLSLQRLQKKDKGHFSLSDIWPLALCSLCFLPSESRYNSTALSRCLCICRVLRVRGCRSCKSNMRAIANAAHNTHTLTRLHLTILGWPCLFTSVYAMSVEWQSASGWATKMAGKRKNKRNLARQKIQHFAGVFFFLFLNLQHTVCSAAPTKTSQILDIDIAS